MLYGDITGRIIAAAMKVHGALGNGFQEVIYQRALEIEMPYHDLSFTREYEMPIYYREQQIGTRRVDFFVEGLIMVEIKAIIELENVHLAQAMNYLEAYQMEVGLLLNFGAISLQHRRVHNNPLINTRHGHTAHAYHSAKPLDCQKSRKSFNPSNQGSDNML